MLFFETKRNDKRKKKSTNEKKNIQQQKYQTKQQKVTPHLTHQFEIYEQR